LHAIRFEAQELRPLDLKPENSWEGFAIGFKNSQIAIPIFSSTTIEHLECLKGSKDDKVDEFLMELMLMQAVDIEHSNSGSEQIKFRKILPLIMQADSEPISAQTLVPRESMPSKTAAADFLKSSTTVINMEDSTINRSVQETVNAFLGKPEFLSLSASISSVETKMDAKGSKASDEAVASEEESEIVERIRALNILGEISVASILSWREKIQPIVHTIYKEIDKVC
jgi:hypothetical protein